MTKAPLLTLLVLVAVFGHAVAQETCEETALVEISAALADYGTDIGALFSEIDVIKERYQNCEQLIAEAELSVSEIVDGGHIEEGLWKFTSESTLSDACRERTKRVTDEFYEDVYYNDDGLLVWDAGNRFTNFTFEYLLATRYSRSDEGINWVSEREITSATASTMSGRWDGYWQGNKDFWCTSYGTFAGELVDKENACLVHGEANIRTNPSTRSPKNGSINEQRRVIEKVEGDDGYYWWKLSDNEFVREDVVGSSRSCERL